MSDCKPTGGTPTPPSADALLRGPARLDQLAGTGRQSASDASALASTPLAPRAERHSRSAAALEAPTVAVAYSGGRDSTALLHATICAAQAQGIAVVALHVHHGLSPNADAWLAHCEAECRRWQAEGRTVRLVAQRLRGQPAAGDSIEAWARQARYAALREMALAHGASLVLLGHHRQDQAETWLLQALRGGGVAGLAAMPESVCRGGIVWSRPWLRRPRADLEAYLRQHRLPHIDDDSNADPRYARNRLRLQVAAALYAAFPSAEAALARAAQSAQEANAALTELAELDLAVVADDRGLLRDRWLALSPARRSNALRGWIGGHTGTAAPASLAVRLCDELPTATAGRWPAGPGELRLYRGVLSFAVVRRPDVLIDLRECALMIPCAGSYALPGWGGKLVVRLVTEGGVPLAWLGRVELRTRSGGERFQAAINRPPRSLKKQFQGAAIASFDRHGPLVYSGGQLVYVPGLGLDARLIGVPGQPLVDLRWWPAGGAEQPPPAG